MKIPIVGIAPAAVKTDRPQIGRYHTEPEKNRRIQENLQEKNEQSDG